ncbi:class I SAM-dependent methyltransferase [Kitasatospora sp. NBC_01302]|uniref:class I SAM-dependent methyltransferase n=1 Tax=Kitasatospora sp. NBC_01302 TaxID=2903575 RepID=UPI002E1640E2|nr:class I SAM-dependent methyltransferase [Kitasatospora sp. NBC_01302]
MSTGAEWQEQDSDDFVAYGEYSAPERQTRTDVVASVIRAPEGPAVVLDLCCGEGRLSGTLLKAFPSVTVTGLDLSPAMLSTAAGELAEYGGRFRTERFDLGATDWRERDEAPYAVVSSLAIHHLDGPGKQALFRDVYAMLRPGGAFVVVDLVEPAGDLGLDLARRMWDEAVEAQSRQATGDTGLHRTFRELEWNGCQFPDPLDQPSTLVDQLDWLRAAGFAQVDAYWLEAGHAIFGGVKRGT